MDLGEEESKAKFHFGKNLEILKFLEKLKICNYI